MVRPIRPGKVVPGVYSLSSARAVSGRLVIADTVSNELAPSKGRGA